MRGWGDGEGFLFAPLLPSFLPPSSHALAPTEPLPCLLVWGRVQGTECALSVKGHPRRRVARSWRGPWG